MTPPRYFLRVPVFDTVADAIDWCQREGAETPVLHTRPGGDVVGVVEVGRGEEPR